MVCDILKIAICDDNVSELQQVKSVVLQFIRSRQSVQPMSVHAFERGSDLFGFTQKYGGFDLVITDVVMPNLSGIELASKLRANNDNCKILFLTTSSEFAVDSYKVKAWYYLLKSEADAELPVLLERVLNDITGERETSLVLKEKGKLTRVPMGSVRFVESVNHTVYFHLHNNGTISCFGTMNDYHEILVSDKRFVKCHKSYIVNMQYVTSITGKDFVLTEGEIVPISRTVYQQIKNEYFDYIFNHSK